MAVAIAKILLAALPSAGSAAISFANTVGSPPVQEDRTRNDALAFSSSPSTQQPAHQFYSREQAAARTVRPAESRDDRVSGPKAQSEHPAPEGSGTPSLSALMKQEEAALRASSIALERFQRATSETHAILKEKKAAEERNKEAATAVTKAVAALTDAKVQRMSAAKKDLQSDPMKGSPAQKELSIAESKVESAEQELKKASDTARAASAEAQKVAEKATHAVEKQAEAGDQVAKAQTLAEALASAIKKARILQDRQEKELAAAMAGVESRQAKLEADVKKITRS